MDFRYFFKILGFNIGLFTNRIFAFFLFCFSEKIVIRSEITGHSESDRYSILILILEVCVVFHYQRLITIFAFLSVFLVHMSNDVSWYYEICKGGEEEDGVSR